MLKSMFLILSTSYFAWYMERFEIAMLYPFDASYVTPGVAGEPRLTEIPFETRDGETLVVWRADAAVGKPTILYLPGNAGGLKDRVDRFSTLIDMGFGVTAMAYRGSSGSTGKPDEPLLVDDAAALAMTENGAPLIVYGESLGTAIAIKVAALGLGDAVILEAPFTSITELVQSQYPNEELEDLLTQRWESHSLVSELQQPLLVMHGNGDQVVPFHMGQAIYAAAGSPQKHFFEVPGHGHNDLWAAGAEGAVIAFVDGL